MMKKTTVFLIFLALVAACQSGPDKNDMAENIKSLQKAVGEAAQPAPDQVEALQNALVGYAEAFPKDSLSVRYLSKAGETARLLRQFDKALEIFGKIEQDYPNSKEAAAAMFMTAFTLDNDLKKMDEAKTAYEAFLKKYPNDEFADDAQFLLNNLGKSPEELIREFEKNAQ